MAKETGPEMYLVGPKSFDVNHGGTKARSDIETICRVNGVESLRVGGKSIAEKLASGLKILRHSVSAGNIYVFNFPSSNVLSQISLFLLSRRNKIVLIVHDIDQIRDISPTQPLSGLNLASVCIVTGRLGDLPEVKTRIAASVHLECWDYLLAEGEHKDPVGGDGILFAGNLGREKSPWLYEPSRQTRLFLAGIGYSAEAAVASDTYLGPFDPGRPQFPPDIGWGLVWDGMSPHDLSGPTGSYQRLNQPHKFSLYLAMGLPIICSRQAAVADLVKAWDIGLCVSSIDDIADALRALPAERLAQMREHAREKGVLVRSGHFLSEAIRSATRALAGPK